MARAVGLRAVEQAHAVVNGRVNGAGRDSVINNALSNRTAIRRERPANGPTAKAKCWRLCVQI